MTDLYRVLFITDRFPPQAGGVGVSAQRLARGLASRGHLVHVLVPGADVDPGAVASTREEDLMVHRLGMLETLDLTLQVAETVITHLHHELRFDLFHGHFLTPAGYLAAYTARRLGAASYISVRGNDVDRGAFRSDQLPFILWTMAHAGGIGCVSRELADKCAALSARDAIRFTPNAVDTASFRPLPPDAACRQSLGISDAHAVLGFVGELRFKKGTVYLLDAFREVHAQRPVKLLLVGSMRSEEKAFLRRYLHQFPALRDDIITLDYTHDREELVRLYNLMDVVLCPSLWDGMPNSVLEAMACERVVLASDAGGIRDVITHGENGFMVGVHELPRLGEGCLELLSAAPDMRRQIGLRAREAMMAHFTPAAELDRLLEAYADVLAITSA